MHEQQTLPSDDDPVVQFIIGSLERSIDDLILGATRASLANLRACRTSTTSPPRRLIDEASCWQRHVELIVRTAALRAWYVELREHGGTREERNTLRDELMRHQSQLAQHRRALTQA